MLRAVRGNARLWYAGYALQGLVVFGTGGILMPIIVGQDRNAAVAGTVMAMFYVGQLAAPLAGALADRTGRHRLIFLSGFGLLALGLAVFPFTGRVWFWMILAVFQGIGSGSSNTLSAMFIVEHHPKSEWDARISVLQTFYGVGQCVGLGLAAYFQAHPALGLVVSAGLMVPGIALGGWKLPRSAARRRPASTTFERRSHRPPRAVVPQLVRYESEFSSAFKHSLVFVRSPFALCLIGWFFIMLATWMLGVLYPLLMKNALGVSYAHSSLYYAVGAAIGIFAYAPSGALGKAVGDGWVVLLGALMTLISTGGLALLAFIDVPARVWLVPIVYVLIPIAWSPLIVGGTSWAAALAPFGEGEALGLFNASSAISSVIAAFATGLIAHHLSFPMVLVGAAISSAVALAIFLPLQWASVRKRARSSTPEARSVSP